MVKVWGLCIRTVWYLTDQLMIDKLTWWYLDIFCWLQQDYAHSEDYPLRRYGRAAGVEPCIHTTITPNRTSYSVHLESVSKRLARLARCEIFWQPAHMIPIYQHIYQRCLRISSCFMLFTYLYLNQGHESQSPRGEHLRYILCDRSCTGAFLKREKKVHWRQSALWNS